MCIIINFLYFTFTKIIDSLLLSKCIKVNTKQESNILYCKKLHFKFNLNYNIHTIFTFIIFFYNFNCFKYKYFLFIMNKNYHDAIGNLAYVRI